MSIFPRTLVLTVALAALAVPFAAVAQVGPPGGMIYASDRLFQTVGTPTDLPENGMFDQIYVLRNGLAAVAEAAPGEQEYNGGRWEVHLVEFLTIPPTQFTNDEDLHAAASRGEVSIGPVVRRFECPLIPAR